MRHRRSLSKQERSEVAPTLLRVSILDNRGSCDRFSKEQQPGYGSFPLEASRSPHPGRSDRRVLCLRFLQVLVTMHTPPDEFIDDDRRDRANMHAVAAHPLVWPSMHRQYSGWGTSAQSSARLSHRSVAFSYSPAGNQAIATETASSFPDCPLASGARSHSSAARDTVRTTSGCRDADRASAPRTRRPAPRDRRDRGRARLGCAAGLLRAAGRCPHGHRSG